MARLTPITSKDQVPPADHAIVDGIISSRGSLHGPFAMFLHCPGLAGSLARLRAFVRFEGTLEMRVRVLAATTVTREDDGHSRIRSRVCLGCPDRQRLPAENGRNHDQGDTREPHGWPSPEDLMLIEFTRALLRRHRVSDDAVAAMSERFGDDGSIQPTDAIGYYSMLSMTVNACELEPAPGADVLEYQRRFGFTASDASSSGRPCAGHDILRRADSGRYTGPPI